MSVYGALRSAGGDGFLPPTQMAAAAVDEDGAVTAWSPGAELLLGYAPQDVVGQAASGLLADGLSDSARRHLAQREAWVGRVALRDQSGRRVEVDLRACPLLDAEGHVQWFLQATVPQDSNGVALALQRSLLQRRVPVQQAVDTAVRYLPADPQAGVGGDWFDVIALSGARVALVVGDVVGHGIHASAAMGRLRTAVRTLADVDADFPVAEGSLLVLYTDGLVEARDRDIATGLWELRRALARPGRSLEDLCDAVIHALLPEPPDDDVALLIARTHALDASHVAAWQIPPDPAAVADARRRATAQLARWGLQEAQPTTELIVSELVTNAIRHASAPIELRLIHNGTLICEVSDASSTSPHPRRAHELDEGGRGLLLVGAWWDRPLVGDYIPPVTKAAKGVETGITEK